MLLCCEPCVCVDRTLEIRPEAKGVYRVQKIIPNCINGVEDRDRMERNEGSEI